MKACRAGADLNNGNTHILSWITQGRGSSFSLEIPLGVRFMIHSRLFTEEDAAQLAQE